MLLSLPALFLLDDVVLPEEVLFDGAPTAESPAPPADAAPPVALVPKDAFPTAVALDAIFAALAGPPPGPDAALRQEVAAQLGLDAATAADAALFEAALAALPPPGPEPDPAAPAGLPAPEPAGLPEEIAIASPISFDWDALSRDWLEFGRGWMLG
ncbi:hypothetical protein [Roseomonas sp. HF4]|uniref:hypothetical protein n=1 Tax=Roseomonas sp. HF4 TaxID=2562313 RepID=UPI0010C091E8|nr:hypothetical protein [Roseomonas sp. HF4]